jgi:hypothetical protein
MNTYIWETPDGDKDALNNTIELLKKLNIEYKEIKPTDGGYALEIKYETLRH